MPSKTILVPARSTHTEDADKRLHRMHRDLAALRQRIGRCNAKAEPWEHARLVRLLAEREAGIQFFMRHTYGDESA